ncbi:MAG: MoaD/ThiS family protein [Candidatus Zipacnadales bacterium]
MVKVKLFANLREATHGQRLVECVVTDPLSATELLQQLVDRYGEPAQKLFFTADGVVRDSLVIMCNGRLIRDRDEKLIAPDDEVAILMPIAGG